MAGDLGIFQQDVKVLVPMPHTGDEFGCAGTIPRFVRTGAQVRYVAFSTCETSVPDGLPSDVLVHECRACLALGVRDTPGPG